MEKFFIYRGHEASGKLPILAISESVTENPAEYFLPGTSDVEKIGELEIEGDTHLLNAFFVIN
jgi:hypothetical protein